MTKDSRDFTYTSFNNRISAYMNVIITGNIIHGNRDCKINEEKIFVKYEKLKINNYLCHFFENLYHIWLLKTTHKSVNSPIRILSGRKF